MAAAHARSVTASACAMAAPWRSQVARMTQPLRMESDTMCRKMPCRFMSCAHRYATVARAYRRRAGSAPFCLPRHRERRFRVYEEAPGSRPGPGACHVIG